MKMTTSHGGARPGAGKKTAYPGKADGTAFAYVPSSRAARTLDRLARRTGLSWSDLVQTLVLTYHDTTIMCIASTARVLYPDKEFARRRRLIITAPADDMLIALRERQSTSRTWSDLIEHLVHTFAKGATYPQRPMKKQAAA